MTWYPRKLDEQIITRKIMREAYLEGWNVKEISGYFRVCVGSVYNMVNIKGLKAKRMEKRLLTKIENC